MATEHSVMDDRSRLQVIDSSAEKDILNVNWVKQQNIIREKYLHIHSLITILHNGLDQTFLHWVCPTGRRTTCKAKAVVLLNLCHSRAKQHGFRASLTAQHVGKNYLEDYSQDPKIGKGTGQPSELEGTWGWWKQR